MTVLIEVFLHLILLDDYVLLDYLAHMLLARGNRQTLPLVEKLGGLFFISFIVLCLGGGLVGKLGRWLGDEVCPNVLPLLLILRD